MSDIWESWNSKFLLLHSLESRWSFKKASIHFNYFCVSCKHFWNQISILNVFSETERMSPRNIATLKCSLNTHNLNPYFISHLSLCHPCRSFCDLVFPQKPIFLDSLLLADETSIFYKNRKVLETAHIRSIFLLKVLRFCTKGNTITHVFSLFKKCTFF